MTALVSAATRCPVCDAEEAQLLDPPHPSRSLASAGVILGVPLSKMQCLKCGLLRQSPLPDSVKAELYGNKYGWYHKRPGTAASELARYATMATWIFAELAPFNPSSLMDVGCGAGFLLDALRQARPSIAYAGIDPSIENSALARARGFSVTTGIVSDAASPNARYDVVLASNVISHIGDPVAFLRTMAALTAPGGRVVLYSHNGAEPAIDHLYADVEFSFCREHLAILGGKAGLALLPSRGIAPPAGQADKHVLVFEQNEKPAANCGLSPTDRETLVKNRPLYFESWRQLAARLARQTDTNGVPVLNFGASFFSMVLATYCPEYWARVEACIVDDAAGTFLDKPVRTIEQVPPTPPPLLVLGTNPASQVELKQRLSGRANVITWNDMIRR